MANKQIKKERMRARRRARVRKKIKGTPERPRMSVFRSLNNIQVQLIDDTVGASIVGLSTSSSEIRDRLDGLTSRCEKSREVGRLIAIKAQEVGVKKVVFDRGKYLYHGRVQALAEGAREAGLNF